MIFRQDRTQLATEHEQIARAAADDSWLRLDKSRYPIPSQIIYAYAQVALHHTAQVWDGRREFKSHAIYRTHSELYRLYERHSKDGVALARQFDLSFNDQIELLDLRIKFRRKSRHLLPLKQLIVEMFAIDQMSDVEIARQLDMSDVEVTRLRLEGEERLFRPKILGGDRHDPVPRKRRTKAKRKRRRAFQRKVSPSWR